MSERAVLRAVYWLSGIGAYWVLWGTGISWKAMLVFILLNSLSITASNHLYRMRDAEPA